MYIDTHCHLFKEYFDNICEVIKRASDNETNLMITNGCDKKSNEEVLETILKHDEVYGAIGYHPTETYDITTEDLKFLEEKINSRKIVAIGEIGLDFHYDNTDKEKQIFYFKKQIELAIKYNKPMIIHSRDAISSTYETLKEYSNYNIKGIIHAYSGSIEMAHQFIKLGFVLGIGGVATFKNAKTIKEVIKEIDLKYIVLETDAPYLTPEPYRKHKNEPLYIKEIAKKIAEIKDVELDEVARVTTSTARRIFDF